MDGQLSSTAAWTAGAVAAIGIGTLLFGSAFGRLKLRRKVADTPTSRVRSVAMGPAELKGMAVPLGPALVGPFTGLPCCWWRITVEQEQVEETRNGTRRTWRAIHAGQSDGAFQLEDDGAFLPVHPSGAQIECPLVLEHVTAGGVDGIAGAALGWLSGIGKQEPSAGIPAAPEGLPGPAAVEWITGSAFSPRRRLREWQIPQHQPLYALGVVRAGRPGEGPALAAGAQGEPFLLTTETEEQLLRRLTWSVEGSLAGGAALILGGAYVVLRQWPH